MPGIKFEEATPRIGTIVHVQRSKLLDPALAAECLELLEERIVLVFPKIGLTDREQLAFTDLLGERIRYTTSVGEDIDPDIYQVTLDRKVKANTDYVLGTFFWHMDGITSDIPPPKATLLSARAVAASGGETEFANCFAAYDELPADEKNALRDLRVLHSVFASVHPALELTVTPENWSGVQGERTHPLVWTHPSGRKSLLVGSHADRVIGMPLPAGRALLARLLEWTARPEFVYRHAWETGDFVVWNNCGSLHRVLPYDEDSGRMMHRTSIAGREPVI